MKRVAKQMKNFMAFASLLALIAAGTASAQEQVVEYGRIVQADDGTGSMGYLVGYEDEEVQGPAKKPWLPLLSPMMIHLDCWITRMVNINDFYSQQAADEYFAMAESCADIPLSMDPNINMGLKYTVLSPIYAWCPDLLNRRGILGGGGAYGIPSPMPSVAGVHAGASISSPPQPMSPSMSPPPSMSPGAPSQMNLQPMPDANLQPLPQVQPAPAGVGVEVGSQSSAPARASSGQVAGNQWSQMTDEQILAHFGLDPSVATRARQAASMDGSKLEQPVADAPAWQFADEAPTVSLERKDMVALNHETFPPRVEPVQSVEPVIVREPVVSQPKASDRTITEEPTIELEFDESSVDAEAKPEFSSTDSEYDKLREIERDLLNY